ncbi:RICIN domain-containing protein [Enterobacter roggenkampii]|nr:RICIN domain-containing protein [Enterobacter roggenkampii]
MRAVSGNSRDIAATRYTKFNECLYENEKHEVYFGDCHNVVPANVVSASSVWYPKNNSLINLESGYCLDIPPNPDTPLITYPCHYGDNQQWLLPNANVHFKPMEIRGLDNKVISYIIGAPVSVVPRDEATMTNILSMRMTFNNKGNYDVFLLGVTGKDECFIGE